jgi:hypothetical protein
MSRVLLDTPAYSAFLRGHPGVIEILRSGLRTRSFSPPLSLANCAPVLRAAHTVAGTNTNDPPIPTNDIWIAASAMELGAAVLTTDAHFRRISHILVIFHDP